MILHCLLHDIDGGKRARRRGRRGGARRKPGTVEQPAPIPYEPRRYMQDELYALRPDLRESPLHHVPDELRIVAEDEHVAEYDPVAELLPVAEQMRQPTIPGASTPGTADTPQSGTLRTAAIPTDPSPPMAARGGWPTIQSPRNCWIASTGRWRRSAPFDWPTERKWPPENPLTHYLPVPDPQDERA